MRIRVGRRARYIEYRHKHRELAYFNCSGYFTWAINWRLNRFHITTRKRIRNMSRNCRTFSLSKELSEAYRIKRDE